jgi:hypothetical protein
MNMKRAAFSLFGLALIAFLVVAGPALLPVAHAGQAINNGSVSGSYTFEFEGSDPNPNFAHIASVGLANFDGVGNISGNFTTVAVQHCCITGTTSPTPFQTTIQTGTFTGTYNVNPDGTATVQFVATTTINPDNLVVTSTVNLVAGFSGDFKRFKFVQIGDSSDPRGEDLPQVATSGRGEKVSR